MSAATVASTAWMERGACISAPGLPWTSDAHTVPTVLVELMASTCAGCPVLVACRAFADTAGVEGGFWAGADRDPRPYADRLEELWTRVEWLPVRRTTWTQAALPLDGLLSLLGAA